MLNPKFVTFKQQWLNHLWNKYNFYKYGFSLGHSCSSTSSYLLYNILYIESIYYCMTQQYCIVNKVTIDISSTVSDKRTFAKVWIEKHNKQKLDNNIIDMLTGIFCPVLILVLQCHNERIMGQTVCCEKGHFVSYSIEWEGHTGQSHTNHSKMMFPLAKAAWNILSPRFHHTVTCYCWLDWRRGKELVWMSLLSVRRRMSFACIWIINVWHVYLPKELEPCPYMLSDSTR